MTALLPIGAVCRICLLNPLSQSLMEYTQCMLVWRKIARFPAKATTPPGDGKWLIIHDRGSNSPNHEKIRRVRMYPDQYPRPETTLALIAANHISSFWLPCGLLSDRAFLRLHPGPSVQGCARPRGPSTSSHVARRNRCNVSSVMHRKKNISSGHGESPEYLSVRLGARETKLIIAP